MIVHLGVIIIAVALAASNSYTHSAALALETGRAGRVGRAHVRAHSVDVRTNDNDSKRVLAANVVLDGGQHVPPGDHDVPQHGQSMSARRACAPGSPRTST